MNRLKESWPIIVLFLGGLAIFMQSKIAVLTQIQRDSWTLVVEIFGLVALIFAGYEFYQIIEKSDVDIFVLDRFAKVHRDNSPFLTNPVIRIKGGQIIKEKKLADGRILRLFRFRPRWMLINHGPSLGQFPRILIGKTAVSYPYWPILDHWKQTPSIEMTKDSLTKKWDETEDFYIFQGGESTVVYPKMIFKKINDRKFIDFSNFMNDKRQDDFDVASAILIGESIIEIPVTSSEGGKFPELILYVSIEAKGQRKTFRSLVFEPALEKQEIEFVPND